MGKSTSHAAVIDGLRKKLGAGPSEHYPAGMPILRSWTIRFSDIPVARRHKGILLNCGRNREKEKEKRSLFVTFRLRRAALPNPA